MERLQGHSITLNMFSLFFIRCPEARVSRPYVTQKNSSVLYLQTEASCLPGLRRWLKVDGGACKSLPGFALFANCQEYKCLKKILVVESLRLVLSPVEVFS